MTKNGMTRAQFFGVAGVVLLGVTQVKAEEISSSHALHTRTVITPDDIRISRLLSLHKTNPQLAQQDLALLLNPDSNPQVRVVLPNDPVVPTPYVPYDITFTFVANKPNSGDGPDIVIERTITDIRSDIAARTIADQLRTGAYGIRSITVSKRDGEGESITWDRDIDGQNTPFPLATGQIFLTGFEVLNERNIVLNYYDNGKTLDLNVTYGTQWEAVRDMLDSKGMNRLAAKIVFGDTSSQIVVCNGGQCGTFWPGSQRGFIVLPAAQFPSAQLNPVRNLLKQLNANFVTARVA